MAQAGEFKLLFGTERITDDVMYALKELSQETQMLAKMEAMQRGEVINKIEGLPSENRMVLHTAMRDFFAHPNQGKEAQKAAKMAKAECDKLKIFLDKNKHFTDLVQNWHRRL